MPFQIHALPAEPFEHLFTLTDAELAEQNAVRVIADADQGFPCRVSLADANQGDEMILLNHQHLSGATPYAATHAIYVRKDVKPSMPKQNEVPDVLSSRLLSVRAFDQAAMMRDADVVEGTELAPLLNKMLDDPTIAFVDIHNAKQGCFAAKATRS